MVLWVMLSWSDAHMCVFLCLYACVRLSFDRLFSLVSHHRDENVLREPFKELLRPFLTAVDFAAQRCFGNCFGPVILEVLLNSCTQTPPLVND